MSAVVRQGHYRTFEHITLDTAYYDADVKTLCGRTLTVAWYSEKIAAWLPVCCKTCARSFLMRIESVT